jgi:hypothetical protein
VDVRGTLEEEKAGFYGFEAGVAAFDGEAEKC